MRSATIVEVAATELATGLATGERPLTRCARHGRPAVEHLEFAIVAPGPPVPWWKRYLFSSVYVWQAVADLLTKGGDRPRTPVTGWPMCDRCRRRRRVARTLARVMFWAGLAGFAGGLGLGLVLRLSTGDDAPAALMAPVLVGLALMLLAAIPLTVSRPDRIARVQATHDGATVRLADPHPEFAGQLRTLLSAHGKAPRQPRPTGRSRPSG